MIRLPKLFILVSAVFAFFWQPCVAQDNGATFEIKPQVGAHTFYDQGHLLQDIMYGVDVNYMKTLKNSSDDWVRRSNAKSYGIGFVYRNFDRFRGASDSISKSFGSSFGLVGQLKIQLLKWGRTSFNVRPQLGVSYVTKNYFTHPQNTFLGSHLNQTIMLDGGFDIPLANKSLLQVGLTYLHLSNGGMVIPNGGLNTVSAYVGLGLGSGLSTKQEPAKSSFVIPVKHGPEFAAGWGQRGVYQTKRALGRGSLYAGYGYDFNQLVRLKLGLDAVHYFTHFDPDRYVETYQNYGTSYEPWRLGISLGADFRFWRVVANTQLGQYLYFKRLKQEASWYWVLGTSYFVTPKWGVQVKSYMHLAQADFFSYGLVFKP